MTGKTYIYYAGQLTIPAKATLMATKRLDFFPINLLIKSEVIAAIKQDAEGLALETAVISCEEVPTPPDED